MDPDPEDEDRDFYNHMPQHCWIPRDSLLLSQVGGGKRERLEKAYECEACQKKFARKAHLQRHEKV